MALIHASKYKPRVFPVKGDDTGLGAEIDRAQSITPSIALNREKVKEIGRTDAVGYIKRSPTVGYTLTQYEYGNIEFWQKLINSTTKGNVGQTEIDLDDFKTAYFDIVAYLTDDDDNFKGTVWYPGLRTSGFSLTIGDPQAIIERSFDFVGESAITWQGDNKYFIMVRSEVESGDLSSGNDYDIDLSTRVPVEDPVTADKFMQRVVRIRSGVSTELTAGSSSGEYEYTASATTLTVHGAQIGDIYKVYYTSSTAPATQFTDNDADPAGLTGEDVSIYLYVPGSGKPSASDYLYRLQSVTLEVSFEREDIREIGNKEIVARGARERTVTVTLGRIVDDFTVEEVLSGAVDDFGKLDVQQFSDDMALIIKIYDDNTKANFKYGFLATGLSPTEVNPSVAVNEYHTKETVLECETLKISADSTVLGI